MFQIDIFEQQFRSISKIDFMERYLSEVKKKKHFLYDNLADWGSCCIILSSFSSCRSEHVLSSSLIAQLWQHLTDKLSVKQAVTVLLSPQKEYLIIIIISPKYYETVTASPVGLENDERTFNTVYIHKQVHSYSSVPTKKYSLYNLLLFITLSLFLCPI